MPSILTAGDASNGLVQASSNDGALTLQTGAAGAKVDAIALDAAGQATLKQPPKLAASAVVSQVRLNTANGYGSTNNKILRFTNIVENTGSDITYADSATLGASFTINTTGVYAIQYCFNSATSGNLGIVLNDNQGTVAIAGTTLTNILAIMANSTGTGNLGGIASWTGRLPAGSVITAKNEGQATSRNDLVFFTITRVG